MTDDDILTIASKFHKGTPAPVIVGEPNILAFTRLVAERIMVEIGEKKKTDSAEVLFGRREGEP